MYYCVPASTAKCGYPAAVHAADQQISVGRIRRPRVLLNASRVCAHLFAGPRTIPWATLPGFMTGPPIIKNDLYVNLSTQFLCNNTITKTW